MLCYACEKSIALSDWSIVDGLDYCGACAGAAELAVIEAMTPKSPTRTPPTCNFCRLPITGGDDGTIGGQVVCSRCEEAAIEAMVEVAGVEF